MIGDILNKSMALLPLDIDPFGRLGPFFHHFLSDSHPTVSLHFPLSRPNACAMYSRIMTYPSPNEILTLTDHIWKNSPPRCFFGHSYTSPTPTIHASEPQSLSCQSIQLAHTSCHPAVQRSYLRLLNRKGKLLDLAGRQKRTKFWFKNLRPIFNPAHHSTRFRLNFLAVKMDSVGKRCGWKLGSTLACPFQVSSPKMIKCTIMYSKK
jgi:hypothetical protein